MENKRYSIVRVDEGCPLSDINIGNTNACKASKSCQDCLHGDTKEQLVRKVAQVILKAWFEDKLKPNCEKISFEITVAKEIVEFLGVE